MIKPEQIPPECIQTFEAMVEVNSSPAQVMAMVLTNWPNAKHRAHGLTAPSLVLPIEEIKPMKDDLIEKVARGIYDELEGPVNNQDYSRQMRQWEQAKRVSIDAVSVVLEEAAKVADEAGDCVDGKDIADEIRALGEKK